MFLAEMIDTFLDDAPGLMAEIEGAVASGDAAALRRAAHTLKSNSRTFGALRLWRSGPGDRRICRHRACCGDR